MITLAIIALTAIISFLALQNPDLKFKLIFNPHTILAKGQWYRFITSGLIHADIMHLLVNMLVLFFFGDSVNRLMRSVFGPLGGDVLFILLYFLALAMSSVRTFYRYKNQAFYNSLGASGAVSAILFAFILFRPMQKIYLYGIIGLPGILWGVAYLGYSWYAAKQGRDYINHEAHFDGAIFGVLFLLAAKPSLLLDFFQQIIP